ncbi:hypothetical protein KJ611_00200 [Patescibacteria group bacterium]|nr:hypothetical protein [Patescibacteria group bacterium]MBU1705662.1 hypothetical protein [Patescibacteria group bacterium]
MFIPKQFKQLRDNACPSPEFKNQLLAKLNQETSMTNQSWVRRFVPAFAAALVLFFALGTGAYAYESPSVTEGHPLHFLKNNFEKFEERFADSPEKQAQFHAKMMERRMGEAEHLGWGSEEAQTLLEAAAAEMDLSVEELVNDLKDPETRSQIMDQLAEQGFEFAEAWQEHREQYGQGKAKGFGIGQHMIDFDDDATDDIQAPVMGRGLGWGLGDDIQELRLEIFNDEDLSVEEKRETFHEAVRGLIEEKVEVKKAELDDEEEDEELIDDDVENPDEEADGGSEDKKDDNGDDKNESEEEDD